MKDLGVLLVRHGEHPSAGVASAAVCAGWGGFDSCIIDEVGVVASTHGTRIGLVLVDSTGDCREALAVTARLDEMGLRPMPTLVVLLPWVALDLATVLSRSRNGFIALPRPADLRDWAFMLEHLAARMRLDYEQEVSSISLGDCAISRNCIQTPTKQIQINESEFQLLRHLAQGGSGGQGDWCSTEQIANGCFKRHDEASRLLVWKHVSTLRRKLSGCRISIDGARGRGYRLTLHAGVPEDECHSAAAR
jgi:biotin operon repressor